MKYVTRSTVLFLIAAVAPMIYTLIELLASDLAVPSWISYSLLVISLVTLTAAIVETIVGYEKADEEEFEDVTGAGS